MKRRLSLFSLALAMCLVATPARAEDDNQGEPSRLDLTPFSAPAAVAAVKKLWVPTDPAFVDSWHSGVGDDAILMTLQEPPYPAHAVSPEVVEDLVRRLVPEAGSAGWASKVGPLGLDVWSTPEGVSKARQAVKFLRDALAPRLFVSATLRARDGGPPPARLVAAGAVNLLPRRWTSVWLRRSVHRMAVGYQVEIAQESVANNPQIAALPEGDELYLRWTPGETVSVVEVFSGEVEALDPRKVDLSGIRNVPESNAQGKVELPRMGVRRVLTAVAVPAGASSVDIGWEEPTESRTLHLNFGAAPAGPPDTEVPSGRIGVVRAGASAASLEDGIRENAMEDAINRFQSGSGTGGREVRALEAYAQAFLLCEATPSQIDRLRAETRRAESGLTNAFVSLKAFALPEGALRADLDAGRVAVGRTLSKEQAETYFAGKLGEVTLAGVDLPMLSGTKSFVRLGASVAGFYTTEVEVAQQSGSILLPVGAWFDGLSGDIRAALVEGGGATLQFSGALAWARHDGSSLELAFRLPVGMASQSGVGALPDDPTARRLPVPLASNGESSAEASATFSAADVAGGRYAVLAILPRGGFPGLPEPVLLLAAVHK